MKKKCVLLLVITLLLVSCQNDKKVLRYGINDFGYNDEKGYVPCDIVDGEIVKKYSVVNPFGTYTYFVSYLYENEKNEYNKVLSYVEDYLIRLSVCYDMNSLYVDSNGDIVKNLAYLNMNYGVDSYIELEKETYDLLKIGFELTKITNGKFNIFVGELSTLWDDFLKGKREDIPSQNELEEAIFLKDDINIIDDILVFNDNNCSVKFNNCLNKKVSITFGGIAKGSATDLISEYLKDKRMLISAGQSSIATYGNTFYDNWSLGIKNPLYVYDDEAYLLYERQGAFSLSTSGDYQNYRIYNGVKYHHIIDCFEGVPKSYWNSVSLIGESGTYADALTTALMLSSFDESIELLNKVKNEKGYEFTPIFMYNDNGNMIAKVSSNIKDQISITEKSNMELVFF